MALPAPKYVQVPGGQDSSIRYFWDDWKVESVDMPIDELLHQRLAAVSHRAVAAFTIATAEWVVYRFALLTDDPFPRQRIEAAWAQVVDFRYSFEEDINLKEWNGPVRGPIGIAVRRVVYALQQAQEGLDPGWRACRAVKLAEHVLPDPAPYQRWREQVLSRIQVLYPINPEEKLGDVVPREALDPENDFRPGQTEKLVNEFLSRLEHKSNPYLNSPERMLKLGFSGIPYVFSLEKDRKQRLD